MAFGSKITMTLDYKGFESALEAVIKRAGIGAKKAVESACEEIKEMSLSEVPRDTNTLASSFFYEVRGIAGFYAATIGYGGNGDPVNPKTGQHASEYMVAVHEDLEAQHPVGKAKFLEDPLREYQQRYGRNAADIIRREIE
jgi:hypothetical protein